ncbi:MAG: hypothetical protein QN183_02290 [Armatimonadota bacterium]|nr:hypothetical protein [Armatimonadota bacterium]MDR7532812.1 hypothetical protein [Armatimonadota bacterium]MDR7535184.1 hypothetical protein [Armatimonadota bacterium]
MGLEKSGLSGPAARAVGARALSILADWSVVEARQGQPAWEDLDRAVAAAMQDGMAPVLVLAHTPQWASLATGADLARPEISSRQPPRHVRDWERFVGLAASRYRGRVRDWQVWTRLGLPAFRGTGGEYLQLLQAAAARIRAVDPQARVVAASPGGVDLGFIVRLAESAPGVFDAIAVPAAGMAPEAMLRPLGVLAGRLRDRGKPVWLEWAPEASLGGTRARAEWTKMLLVAEATGVQRLVVADPDRNADPLRQAVSGLGARWFAGYLARDPDVFVAAAGFPADAVLLAWARAGERTLDLPAAPGLQAATVDGRPVTLEVRDGRVVARLSEIPLVITGVPVGLLEEARAAAVRAPWLPVPQRDFGQSPEVFARLGRSGEERGLYNAAYRSRPNGAVEVVELDGGEAVRTAVGRGVVYVYFDVDDTFLFFSEGRVPLDVTVEVWGARAARSLGFNLLYDAAGGYRFTPWVWVDPGEGWRSYTIRLPDASFANTWGYDFAINAAGNRAEDLTVRAVRVRKALP